MFFATRALAHSAVGPFLRRLPPCLLAATVATGTARANTIVVAPSELERSQAYVLEGDEALERGDYREAIAKYQAAFYGLSATERASYMGSIPVRNAMRAYDQLLQQNRDRAVVEQQLVLLRQFLDGVAGQPDAVEAIGQDVIDDLEALRQLLETELASPSEEATPVHQPTPDEVDDGGLEVPEDQHQESDAGPTSDPPTARRPNWLGIGLTIGGGVVFATGAGVSVGWWTVRKQASEFADIEPSFEMDPDARERYLAGQEDEARKFLIAGSVLAGIGGATLIAGVTHIIVVRRRAKRRRAVSATLLVTPQTAGFVLQSRF